MNSFDLFRTLVFSRGPKGPGEDDMYSHYPIAENVARVRPEDLVVSDYEVHRAEKAKQIVAQICGLGNQVVVTDGGKHRGDVWASLPGKPSSHLGDHQRSDVDSPNENGIRGELCVQWRDTQAEAMLRSYGMPQLAMLCKEARLASWHEDKMLRRIQLCQTQLNFPALYIASCLLRQRVDEDTRLLFSGRDCFMWVRLHEALFDWNCRYWLTSCLARTNPSPEYMRYTRELAGSGKAILVDVSGSGGSFSALENKSGFKSVLMYKPLRANLLNHIPALVQSEDVWRLEQCNRAPERKLMNFGPEGPMYLDRDCTTPQTDVVVATQVEAFMGCIRHAPKYRLERPSGKRAEEVLLWLISHLREYSDAVEPLRQLDIKEDAE